MKPKKSFYNLSYADAMFIARKVASTTGTLDWSLYHDWMSKYEKIQDRREARTEKQLTFHEQLPLL